MFFLKFLFMAVGTIVLALLLFLLYLNLNSKKLSDVINDFLKLKSESEEKDDRV